MPKRIRLSRARGFKLPESAINVARPSQFGNPFKVGRDGTRAEVVSKFAMLAAGYVDVSGRVTVDEQLIVYDLMAKAPTLIGKHDVACWCSLDGKPCHGDIWLHLAAGKPVDELIRFYVAPQRVRLVMRIEDMKVAQQKQKGTET